MQRWQNRLTHIINSIFFNATFLTLSHTEAVLGLLHSLVFEKPPTPPYETTSKTFQITTARIHAIDQSSSSLKIFPWDGREAGAGCGCLELWFRNTLHCPIPLSECARKGNGLRLISVGGRRFAALQRLAKQKKVPKTFVVPYHEPRREG
jgi:hypothetical protein